MPDFVPSLVTTLAATVAITAFPLESQAVTFSFQFDNTFNGSVTPPIVGTGTFSYDGDLGDGTFSLTSLANYNFGFNFSSGSSFTNTDIQTPLANILVRVSTVGSDRFVNFGGSGGGPFGGSIDFRNSSSQALSFQPGFGSGYFLGANFGNYQGSVTPIPEPSTILGTISAIGFCTAFKRKSKKD